LIRQFYDGYGEHFKLSDGSDFKYPSPGSSGEKKEEVICQREEHTRKPNALSDVFSGLKADDLVLIGVLIFLIYDGVEDYILLIILGIIFLMGIGETKC